ncbi:MAG: hypothetical protein PHN78_00420 [Dehalococcoidales bacterium]|nr:hypothetical protein [Dehalococcoidales bacterium]
MKRLLFASIVIILVAAVTSCRSPNDLDQPGITSNGNLTVEESSEINGLLTPVPEYLPPEPSTAPGTVSGGLLYQNLTLKQASEIIGREIPTPAYLPPGYAITSVQLKSVSEPLRDWRIDLTIDNGQPSASITMSISSFSLGMKIPPGAETTKIGNSTAMVSRQQDTINLNWRNGAGWGLSLAGTNGVTFEELLKIAESVTSPPVQVLQASIVPDEDLLVLRGKSKDITIHLQSNALTSVKVSITRDTRISNLPAGIDITVTQTSLTLSPGQSLDIIANVKIGDKVPSLTWPYRPASEVLSTDTPPPFGTITEEPSYSLRLMVSYQYTTAGTLTIQGNESLSTRLRIDLPAALPEAMVTLRDAEEAVDFPVGLLLPAYFPEGTSPPPFGYQISTEEPHSITAFYSTFQVILSPELGITQPPDDFPGDHMTIRKKQVVIGQNRIDWWIYDIHFTVISEKIPMSELKLVAESMMLIGPGSGSWLGVKP